MFLQRFGFNIGVTRRDRKLRSAGADQVEQQVKKVLENSGQKLILMVRG